jgi:hypothetical protein
MIPMAGKRPISANNLLIGRCSACEPMKVSEPTTNSSHGTLYLRRRKTARMTGKRIMHEAVREYAIRVMIFANLIT